jgi:hypothetical protein
LIFDNRKLLIHSKVENTAKSLFFCSKTGNLKKSKEAFCLNVARQNALSDYVLLSVYSDFVMADQSNRKPRRNGLLLIVHQKIEA